VNIFVHIHFSKTKTGIQFLPFCTLSASSKKICPRKWVRAEYRVGQSRILSEMELIFYQTVFRTRGESKWNINLGGEKIHKKEQNIEPDRAEYRLDR
jgi:hypothetical protein